MVGACIGADPRAPGTNGGIEGHVQAAREVILAAGTFNTPQLLSNCPAWGRRRSSVALASPVVKELPESAGICSDRYEVGIVGKAPSDFVLLEKCTFLNGSDPCYDTWASAEGAAKGSYTTNGIAFGWLHHSSVAEKDPDLFLGGVPAYFNGYFPGYSIHALQDLSIWTWLTLKAHSRNNAGTVNLTLGQSPRHPEHQLQQLLRGRRRGSAGGLRGHAVRYQGV